MKLTVLLLCYCVSFVVFSQELIDSAQFNRAIHKSWGGDKIRFFSQQNPEYVQKGLHYFNHSFEVKLKDCPTCDVNLYNLINLELFNVSDFEQLRKEHERNEFTFKAYIISLHSKNEVENYLGESITDFNAGSNYATFPEFDFEDMSTQNLEQYRRLCRFYIQNYKTSYKERIHTPNYRFILLEEIENLSQEEIADLIENPTSFEVRLN